MKPFTHKFAAVLNKKVPSGNVMNALAHMCVGLSASYPDHSQMRALTKKFSLWRS